MMLTPLMREILNGCSMTNRDVHWFTRTTNIKTMASAAAVKNAMHILVQSRFLAPGPMDTYSITLAGRRELDGHNKMVTAAAERVTNATVRGEPYQGTAWNIRPGADAAKQIRSVGTPC